MNRLITPHGAIVLPAFLPDGTRAVVRCADAADAAGAGVRALMVNTLHLGETPGISVVEALGGAHGFMGWEGPLASDSGGFQVYSLMQRSAKMGGVSRKGFTYKLGQTRAKRTLTPEKCIQKQVQLGSDILFCLDYCTHPGEDLDAQRRSVELTVDWARRCKEEFGRRVDLSTPVRPLLFAVVQGGADRDLRRACAEQLLAIGFDGYGYGGWPIGDDGRLVDMVAHVAELVPRTFPLHGLGIGKPGNVVAARRMGYATFDCVLPTRDARHRRLYVFEEEMSALDEAGSFHGHVYIQDEKHVRDPRPVDPTCDCLCCRRYSRAYLHHLFALEEPTGPRLATIHNLRFYTRLMERLRTAETA